MLSPTFLRHIGAPCLALAATAITTPAVAQNAGPVRPPAASASAPASAAAAAASAPARTATPAATPPTQRIEITGGRDTDTEQRRQSTAAKIVIGREEIDKFGDANIGEVLRRLPGVTTPGAPGRGGPPRMRGLGNGFTQLLIDGQRIPPGFSLESLTPEQVERIEILRAPTAETGSRAIAGTINIVTREGFKRRLNDLRLGFGYENGKLSPGINWTYNDSAGDLIYNLSGSVFKPHRESSNETRTTVQDPATGVLLEDRSSRSSTTESRTGANLSGRLQWRLNEAGDMLALMPTFFRTQATSQTNFTLSKPLQRASTPERYDFGDSSTDSSFSNARLSAQWRQRLGPVRLEVNGGGGSFHANSHTLRNEYTTSGTPRALDDRSSTRENALNLNLKATGLAGGTDAGGEHSLVAGTEIDGSQRTENKTSLQNGAPLLTQFGDDLQARALRLAAYVQDEWTINPNWGAHAGLRWEGINTRGDNGSISNNGSNNGIDPRPSNRSSVWTPLLHAVWKPDPKSRDQVRFSLTRSYRSPALGTLLARPTINRDVDPLLGSNTLLTADSVGNPRLKPELATGIDIALERYLDSGGVLSANLFHRNISNLMRSVAQLETVSYSPFPRWVRRQQNIGDATTSGIELEAKFRLDQWVKAATPVEVRSNLSFYNSRVKAVPGPDNRLDQQATATGNLGADYRLRGLPLTLGGNVNWVPGYTTRTDVGQTTTVGTKQVWDAYALWTFSPATALRLLGSNLTARDQANTTTSDIAVAANASERTTVRSSAPSYVNWQLRLELKL